MRDAWEVGLRLLKEKASTNLPKMFRKFAAQYDILYFKMFKKKKKEKLLQNTKGSQLELNAQ